MPIVSGDIVLRYSAPGAASGGTVAGSPGGSLGKYVATNAIPSGVINNLFPDVTGDENAEANIDYQCVFVHNQHASLTLLAPVIWIQSQVAGGATASIGLDSTPTSTYGDTNAQAAFIANKNLAPNAVSFSNPTSKASGLALGDLGPGQVRAVWVRRAAGNSGAINNDGLTLRVQGDTIA